MGKFFKNQNEFQSHDNKKQDVHHFVFWHSVDQHFLFSDVEMSCVLFAGMDKVFSWKTNEKHFLKITGIMLKEYRLMTFLVVSTVDM